MHLDIKPDNICFSRKLGEPIFIDFGFSEIIDEVPGDMTLTSFIGSLNYCSDDMRDIYVNKKPGLVDLYHNDVSCLKKVFNDLKEGEEVRARLSSLYARSE